MFRVGTASNLNPTGTNDLLLTIFPDGFPEGNLVFGLGNTPRKISGLQKVAQLFIKILLTTKNSDPVHTSLGTNFTQYLVGANRQAMDSKTYNDIIDEVQSAEQQVKYILNGTSSDLSEQLAAISVLGVDVTQESVVLYVKLITMAGEQASVAMPFPQLDLKISPNG